MATKPSIIKLWQNPIKPLSGLVWLGLYLPLTIILVALLLIHSNAYAEWVPPYQEDQRDLMNETLDKIQKAQLINKHTTIKDIFKGKAYEPPKDFLPEAANFDRVPEAFENIERAVSAGAQCDYIKSAKRKTCVLLIREDHGAGLIIYDASQGSSYKKTQIVCVPTHYGVAAVDFISILNNKLKFIRIEHETGGGTGLSDLRHWIIGWHDGAFRTVFWEDVYLNNNGSGSFYLLQLQYKINQDKTPWVSMNFRNDKMEIHGEPFDYHSNWNDWLFWNNETFSFYNSAQEDSKIALSKRLSCQRIQIGTERKHILMLPPIPAGLTCTNDSAHAYLNNIYGYESCDEPRKVDKLKGAK